MSEDILGCSDQVNCALEWFSCGFPSDAALHFLVPGSSKSKRVALASLDWRSHVYMSRCHLYSKHLCTVWVRPPVPYIIWWTNEWSLTLRSISGPKEFREIIFQTMKCPKISLWGRGRGLVWKHFMCKCRYCDPSFQISWHPAIVVTTKLFYLYSFAHGAQKN